MASMAIIWGGMAALAATYFLAIKVKPITRLFAYVSLILMIAALPSFAAVESCRHIRAKADRDTCNDRQSKALRKSGDADKPKVDPVDQLKLENDRLSRRLRSICRGC
jgi:hypothetical protein